MADFIPTSNPDTATTAGSFVTAPVKLGSPSPIPSPAPTGKVVVEVGEFRFGTLVKTLTRQSTYFVAFFANHENHLQSDGSYFVDADADLFVYILRYLRRGTLPIFYDAVKGHNDALRLALWNEAQFFGIRRLIDWVEFGYLRRVRTVTQIKVLDPAPMEPIEHAAVEGNVRYDLAWGIHKTYLCPRGIEFHKGNPDACDRKCLDAMGDQVEFEYTPVAKAIEVKTRLIMLPEAAV